MDIVKVFGDNLRKYRNELGLSQEAFADKCGLHRTYISARSIDEVNVQLIMEKLGGGGHMTVAGAQIKNMGMEDAKEVLKGLLLRMKQEGEL